jgi:hypothetical protein
MACIAWELSERRYCSIACGAGQKLSNWLDYHCGVVRRVHDPAFELLQPRHRCPSLATMCVWIEAYIRARRGRILWLAGTTSPAHGQKGKKVHFKQSERENAISGRRSASAGSIGSVKTERMCRLTWSSRRAVRPALGAMC